MKSVLRMWAGRGRRKPRAHVDLLERGRRLEIAGEWDESLDCLERALRSFRESRDVTGQAEALRLIGNIKCSRSQWKEAMSTYLEGLDLCEGSGYRQGHAGFLHCIGTLHFEREEYGIALDLCRSAIEIAREIGDTSLASLVENTLGIISDAGGMREEALGHFDRALESMLEIGDMRGAAHVYHNIALVHVSQGRDAEAEENFGKSMSLAAKIGHLPLIANNLLSRTTLYLRHSDLQTATESCTEALGLFEHLGDKHGVAECLKYLGMIHRELLEGKQSRQKLERAIRIYREIEMPLGEAEARRELALLERSDRHIRSRREEG